MIKYFSSKIINKSIISIATTCRENCSVDSHQISKGRKKHKNKHSYKLEINNILIDKMNIYSKILRNLQKKAMRNTNEFSNITVNKVNMQN